MYHFRLCALMKEENEMSKELQSIERRVEEWGKPLNARIFKPVVNSMYRSQSQEDDDPTGEFQKFVSSSGGHCGGWEEQDHLLFLRERRKYNGKPKFISVVHCLLPGNYLLYFFFLYLITLTLLQRIFGAPA